MQDQTVSGDVSYAEGSNKITAHVNSKADGVVESVKYTKKGSGWSFAPTFNTQNKNVDLEASADYSADTNLNVKVSHDGSAKVKVAHRVDDDTSVTVRGTGTDVNAMDVEVSRRLDADNTVKPRFDVGSKHFALGWVRKLDSDRSLTVDVDPEKSVAVGLEGNNDADWKVNAKAPWGDFKDLDVSVGRKFAF
jgi:hypothetical protein